MYSAYCRCIQLRCSGCAPRLANASPWFTLTQKALRRRAAEALAQAGQPSDEYMTMLCIATYFKGEAFLRECRRQGATVLLLTVDSLADAAWPREAIDEIHTITRGETDAGIRRRVDAIARAHRIDRIVALDDFHVEDAAM